MGKKNKHIDYKPRFDPNPGRIPKLRANYYKPNKGLTAPGHDFLGPFNDNFIGPARNPSDQAAREHDPTYQHWSDYLMNTDSDDKFIEATEGLDGFGFIANNIFKAKRHLAFNKKQKLGHSTSFISQSSPNDASLFHKTPAKADPPKAPVVKTLPLDVSGNISPAVKKPKDIPDTLWQSSKEVNKFKNWLAEGDQKAMSKKELDGDVTMGDAETPAPTSASAAKTGGGGATSGRTGQHGETPVDMPLNIERTPWKPTLTVLHSYYAYTGAVAVTSSAVAAWSYRLNSIYDIRRDTGAITDVEPTLGVAGADAADATVQLPPFRAHYANYYNYWTVLETRYRVRFYIIPNLGADVGNKDIELFAYVYHHGQQEPPRYCEPTGSGTTMITHQMRRLHRGMYYVPLRYIPDTTVTQQVALDFNTISGVYTPGSIHHEVSEDELSQVWHKMTEVPPMKEGLTIIVQKSPTGTYGGQVDVRAEVSLEYVTQYKDLKRDYQYPHQLSDIVNAADVGSQIN